MSDPDKSIYSTTLTPKSIQEGKRVSIEAFQLSDIPAAMRNMGWKIAPKLMEHWFSRDAFEMTERSKIDYINTIPANELPSRLCETNLVKMAWVQSFPAGKQAISKLLAQRFTQNSLSLLRKRLMTAGWDGNKENFPLGFTNIGVRYFESTCQIQSVSIGSPSDTINDFYGAIGRATLKLGVTGYTKIGRDGYWYFVIHRYGIYLKDSYDFVGDSQFLGYWSKKRTMTKAEMITPSSISAEDMGFVKVHNGDFNQYRSFHKKGGDFIIFSDIAWLTAPPNTAIRLPT